MTCSSASPCSSSASRGVPPPCRPMAGGGSATGRPPAPRSTPAVAGQGQHIGRQRRGRSESDSQRASQSRIFAAARRRSRTGPAGGGAGQNGWLPPRRPAALPAGRGHLQRRFTQARRQGEGVKRAVAGRDQHLCRVMRRQRRERAGVVSRPPAAGFVMRLAGAKSCQCSGACPGRSARSAWLGKR